MASASVEAQPVDSETKPRAGEEICRSDDSSWRGLRWFWPIVGGLLLVQAFLAVDCARRWSPTHDEYWHLPIGVFYWQTADWRVDPINPPLVRMWASLPLVLGGVGLELPEKSGWPDRVPMAEEVGDAFHDQHAESYRQHFFCRSPDDDSTRDNGRFTAGDLGTAMVWSVCRFTGRHAMGDMSDSSRS